VSEGPLVGEVTHVRDDDTIKVDGLPIRVNGLAAPEHNEPGGPEATAAMIKLVAGRASSTASRRTTAASVPCYLVSRCREHTERPNVTPSSHSDTRTRTFWEG
jgi:hypothetical protein